MCSCDLQITFAIGYELASSAMRLSGEGQSGATVFRLSVLHARCSRDRVQSHSSSPASYYQAIDALGGFIDHTGDYGPQLRRHDLRLYTR